eukprot:4225303-Pyramimonas_sp.AAC.1
MGADLVQNCQGVCGETLRALYPPVCPSLRTLALGKDPFHRQQKDFCREDVALLYKQTVWQWVSSAKKCACRAASLPLLQVMTKVAHSSQQRRANVRLSWADDDAADELIAIADEDGDDHAAAPPPL